MWWRNATPARLRSGRAALPRPALRRSVRLAVAVLLLGGVAGGLAACGFKPLYGQYAADPAVTDELASIQVDPLRDRHGQLVHNALLTNLTPTGEPARPRYRLVVRLDQIEGQQALRKDETATRDVLFFNISYVLFEGQNRVTAGGFSQVYSYDLLQEHYANISALEDIQRRSATSIALEIKNRLAAYFTKAAEIRATAGAAAPPGATPRVTPQ